MNKVEMKFKNRIAIDRKTYFLFSKEDSIDFIKECKFEAVKILGIDGFYKINENTIQPSMENSVDFSKEVFSENIYNKAIQFLEERDSQLYFEIICDD